MEVKRIVIPYHAGDIFKGYPIGDAHSGTKYCAEGELQRKFKQVAKEPLSFWWDMGDKSEFITPSDWRWEWGAKADWLTDPDNIARQQEDWYCDLVKPAVEAEIGDYGVKKCLGLIEGNHEQTIRKHNHNNVQVNICNNLGVPNLGFSCIYHIVFRRVNSTESHEFKGGFTHGSGNAQTRGGKLMKLRKWMNMVDADFYCMAHMHDIIIETKPYLKSTRTLQLENDEAPGAVTGCFLRTYTQGVVPSYGETRNYDPVPIGCPVFIFDPQRGSVTVDQRG